MYKCCWQEFVTACHTSDGDHIEHEYVEDDHVCTTSTAFSYVFNDHGSAVPSRCPSHDGEGSDNSWGRQDKEVVIFRAKFLSHLCFPQGRIHISCYSICILGTHLVDDVVINKIWRINGVCEKRREKPVPLCNYFPVLLMINRSCSVYRRIWIGLDQFIFEYKLSCIRVPKSVL